MADENNNNNDNFTFSDGDFVFSGFPENRKIDIPDPKPKKKVFDHDNEEDMKEFYENMKDLLPPELLDIMGDNDFVEYISQVMEKLNGAVNGDSSDLESLFNSLVANGSATPDDEENDSSDSESAPKEEEEPYTLNDISCIDPDSFGTIECIEDPEIYENFIKKYGKDSTVYADRTKGVQNCILNDVTSQLPLGNIDDMKYIMHNDRFILFYASTNIPNTFGFYVAAIETAKDEFALFVPTYMNSFNLKKSDNTVTLINPEKQQNLFNISEDGVASFKAPTSAVVFSTEFELCPKERVLLSPHQFGRIRNIRSSIRSSDSKMQIGTITSNESSDAILFKKDADLDLDQLTFPLYINFQHDLPAGWLHALSEIFFEIDFNECPLFDNLELHHTSNNELYVNIDIF